VRTDFFVWIRTQVWTQKIEKLFEQIRCQCRFRVARIQSMLKPWANHIESSLGVEVAGDRIKSVVMIVIEIFQLKPGTNQPVARPVTAKLLSRALPGGKMNHTKPFALALSFLCLSLCSPVHGESHAGTNSGSQGSTNSGTQSGTNSGSKGGTNSASTAATSSSSRAVSKAGTQAVTRSGSKAQTKTWNTGELKGSKKLLNNDNLIPTQNRTQAMAIEAETGRLPAGEDAILKNAAAKKSVARNGIRARGHRSGMSQAAIRRGVLDAARNR
jgi:hypothetical protein